MAARLPLVEFLGCRSLLERTEVQDHKGGVSMDMKSRCSNITEEGVVSILNVASETAQ